MSDIRVYGAHWCGDTRATRAHLDSLGVKYEYLDVDLEPDAKAWVAEQNDGKQKLPTLDIRGDVLVIPDKADLDRALREKGLMA